MDIYQLREGTSAILFDLDGTLADSMPLHLKAWQEVLRAHGGDFPEREFYEWSGVPGPRCIEMLNDQFGWNLDPIELTHEKERRISEFIPLVQPIPHVIDVVHHYRGKLKLAVGSGANRKHILATLEVIGLTDVFDAVVGFDEVAQGKPAPDTWLLCAERVGVEPQYCHVYEDGDPGIQGAVQVGMSYTDVRLFSRSVLQN